MSTSSKHKITVVCPFCQKRVNIEDLPAHKINNHAQQLKLPEAPLSRKTPESAQETKPVDDSSIDLKSSTGEFTSCPVCTVRVKTARLERHLGKVHPNRRYPYQSPRVQETKKPVLDDNASSKRSEKIVTRDPAPSLAVHRPVRKPAPRQPDSGETSIPTPMEGIRISDPELIQQIKRRVITESGILVNTDLFQAEEPRRSREERWKNVIPNRVSSKPEDYAPKITFQGIRKEKEETTSAIRKHKKTLEDSLHQEDSSLHGYIEWLELLLNTLERANSSKQVGKIKCPICTAVMKSTRFEKHLANMHRQEFRELQKGMNGSIDRQKQRSFGILNTDSMQEDNLVKCPLCTHKTKYNVLYVHIQVSHPQVNPKIVMAKFNRAYKSNKTNEKHKYEEELNELVKDYERLKQGQDEPRDGGKYMGHMRREHGKFGSLPLYDDYGDEADA